MSTYYLHRHFHHCVIDDAVVLLNTTTRKYLALPSDYCEAFRKATLLPSALQNAHAPDGVSNEATYYQEAVAALLEAGVLTTSLVDGHPAASIDLVTGSSLFDSSLRRMRPQRIGADDIAAFFASLCTAAWLLRVTRFDSAIRRLQRIASMTRERRYPCDPSFVEHLLLSFQRMRMWTYSASRACLFDSIVLVDFLRRYGVHSTLVFGVKTKPFDAHAWVQRGELVLNDSLERVSRYAPILTI